MKSLSFLLAVAVVGYSTASSVLSTVQDINANGTSPFLKVIKTKDIRRRDAIYTTPATVLVGKLNGDILQCLHENPDVCEVFHKSTRYEVIYSITVHNGFIYAAADKNILKCELNKKQSCRVIYTGDSTVYALAIGEGIFAGLKNGILNCDDSVPTVCRPIHTLPTHKIWSLQLIDQFILAGSDKGEMFRCSLKVDNSCFSVYDMGKCISSLTNAGNDVLAVTWNDKLWNCSRKSNTIDHCGTVALNFTNARAVALFDNSLYVLQNEERIHVCKWANNSCSTYADQEVGSSMTFVYGTYQMQSRYRNENTACTWQSDSMCPPLVTYYNEQQRSLLEVHVKDGKLYNSVGALVDTSSADEGHAGPAAIFAMGPDGRLLLSNSHKRELLHTSSLFAGAPVAGAGEMTVINGVIKQMTACSEHYRPDVNLNKQVVSSLLAQGYTDPIESQECSEDEWSQNIETSLLSPHYYLFVTPMTQSPKKYVSAFTSSTTNRGVEAKEREIANTQLDTDGSSTQCQSDVDIRSASGDTGSYLQVVVQKHKKKDPAVATTQTSPRLPVASSPIKPIRNQDTQLYLLQQPMLLAYPNPPIETNENITKLHPHRKEASRFWSKFKDTNDSPDKIDLYYFERNSGEFLSTSDGTFTYSESFAIQLSRIPNRIVAEFFAIPQIIAGIPVAILLNLERSVFIVLRSFLVGSVQIWSDYIFKPILTLSFNALIQPPLVLAGNVGRAVRNAMEPFAGMLGDFLEPVVKVLSAIKLVRVEKRGSSHTV